jgi:hypothetical protein
MKEGENDEFFSMKIKKVKMPLQNPHRPLRHCQQRQFFLIHRLTTTAATTLTLPRFR